VARALAATAMSCASTQDAINRLNVYPVPDGTPDQHGPHGGGVVPSWPRSRRLSDPAELTRRFRSPGQPATGGPDMGSVCRAIAHGSLMGPGNSGVILSSFCAAPPGSWRRRPRWARWRWPRPWPPPAPPPARPFCARWRGPSSPWRRRRHRSGRRLADGVTLTEVLQAARQTAAEALARTPEQLPVLRRPGWSTPAERAICSCWTPFSRRWTAGRCPRRRPRPERPRRPGGHRGRQRRRAEWIEGEGGTCATR